MLRPSDEQYLRDRGVAFRVVPGAHGVHLILEQMDSPAGLLPTQVDILIILPPGFNDCGPDMFWCAPFVSRRDGQAIAGTETLYDFDGRTWQRWSRHIGGSWRPGIDNLASYIAYVKRAMANEAQAAA